MRACAARDDARASFAAWADAATVAEPSTGAAAQVLTEPRAVRCAAVQVVADDPVAGRLRLLIAKKSHASSCCSWLSFYPPRRASLLSDRRKKK